MFKYKCYLYNFPESYYKLILCLLVSTFVSFNIIYYSLKTIYDITIASKLMTKYSSEISDTINTRFIQVYTLLGLF